MTWWPDKVTQVNYLNYMSQQGFSDKTYTTDMMSYDLAAAAETVQRGIEERIGREGNTTWLRQLMSDFIKTQPGWNSESEDNLLVGKDHLQGGALTFLNNSATSHANSDFRLMNRTPTTKRGHANTILTVQMVVTSCSWLTISTTLTQLFRQSN